MRGSRILPALLATAGLTAAMTESQSSVAEGISPKELLELPRPGTGVPSPDGKHIAISVSQHSFADRKTTKSIYVSSIASPNFTPLLTDANEYFWLNDHTIAYLKEDGDISTLRARAIDYPVQAAEADETEVDTEALGDSLIGRFPATVGNLKFRDGTLVFSAEVWEDGDLETVVEQDKAYEERDDTGEVYDSTFVRHWDTFINPHKFSKLFSVDVSHLHIGKGYYRFSTSFVPLLNDSNLSAPVGPFGGADDFDVSARDVVFTAKDPHVNPAWHTRQNIYLVSLRNEGKPRELTSGTQGATSNPTFSPDGHLVAWCEQRIDGYESDRNRIMLFDIKSGKKVGLTEKWDRSASSLVFSPDGKMLYFTAEDEAHVKLFSLPVPSSLEDFKPSQPKALVSKHSTSGVAPLADGRIVLTQSSLTSPNEIFVLEKKGGLRQVSSFSTKALEGKRLDEGEEIFFTGAEGKDVHAWVVRPPGFNRGAKAEYPLAFLIHGGPQGAWTDSWSTRWNPNVFASQGYVVVTVNPTGSTGFGQDFTDAIQNEWGGRPWKDLIAGAAAVLRLYPEVDPERLACGGASYGGYSSNWMNAHNTPGFKAFFTHDGVFSTLNTYYTTEEIYPEREFGGLPWEKGTSYEKWNPANFVEQMTTPHLIIHSSKDYRLTEGEGLAMFNQLQRRGVPSRYLTFPDENHWVLKPGNSLRWHNEIFRWLDQWVGRGSAAADRSEGLILQQHGARA